jgi:hypothetical protein
MKRSRRRRKRKKAAELELEAELSKYHIDYEDVTREWVESNNLGHIWKEDPVYGYDLGPELLGSFCSTSQDAETGECIETYYLFKGLMPVDEFMLAQRRGDYETFTIRKKDFSEPTIFPAEYRNKLPASWLRSCRR